MEKKKKAKKSFRFLFVLAFAFAMSMFMTSAAFADAGVSDWAGLQGAFNNGEDAVLTDNITAAEDSKRLVVPNEKNVTLDLNGHTIDYSAAVMDTMHGVGGPAITVDGGSLTLRDSSTNAAGKITGGKCLTGSVNCGGGVLVNSGSFTMESGEISGNSAINGGGVFVGNNVTFTMKGGKISNNGNSNTGSLGGGVFVDGGKFLMEGGEISGNELGSDSLDWGGGVYVANGNFTMKGGKIADNKADYGGGVSTGYTASANPSFNMEGGEISGNTANKGGGVSLVTSDFDMSGGTVSGNIGTECGGGVYLIGDDNDPSTLKLAGNVIINGNKNGTASDAANSNVYIETTTAREKITLTGSLTEDTSIGVTMKSPGTFTSSNETHASDYAGCFFSDNGELAVQAEGNELKLAEVTEYPVWVGATQVTKDNKNDILGDGGKAKYDPAQKTLTLDNPTIKDVYSNNYTAVIYSELDKLVIKGKATLTNPATDNNSQGIYAPHSDVELNGEFTVKAGYYCIAAENLTVSGGTVDAENGIISVTNDFSITGGDVIVNSKGVSVSAYGKLDISKGSLEAKTSSNYGVAINSEEGITIGDGLMITEPEGGTVGKMKEGVDGIENEYWTVLDGENVASSVTIAPAFTVKFLDGQGDQGTILKTEVVRAGQAATPPADPTREGYVFDGWDKDFSKVTENLLVTAKWNKTYPVWVGATQVTENTKDDVLGDGGKAKYDPDTNTLTLNNPQIKDFYSGPNAPHASIYATQNNLMIKGSANMTNPDTTVEACGIYVSGGNVELNGDFTIKATYYGIGASGGDITISGGNVNVTSDAGIQGNNIRITGGTLTSAAKGRSIDAKSIDISDGLRIVRPASGEIVGGQSRQWIVDGGGNRAKVVVISEKSNLKLVTFSAGYKDNSGLEIILKADTVESGQGATAPEDPTRPGYTFVGWDTDFSNVTEDLTVTAKWKENVVPVETDQYAVWVGATKVTKDNRDDVLGDGGKVKFDPATKTLTLDDPEIKDVYKADADSFDACIYSKLDSALVIKGKATLTNVQSKRNSHEIYASGHDVKLDGDFTVNAGYYGIIARDLTASGGTVTVESRAGVRTQNNIDVKGGTLISISSGKYGLYANNDINIGEGLSIVRPAGGTIGKNSEFGYTYIQDADGNVAKQVIISSEPDWYFVTFSDGQGDTLKTEAVKGGKAATAPEEPTREGYTFDGWDKDFSKVTEDLTVTAKWKKIVSIKNAKVVLSATAFAYNGKVRKPAIKKIGGKALKAGTDYTVKWSNKSSKNVGAYTVTITGKGNYTGVTKAAYKINPKGTGLAKLVTAKTAITVKWKKQSAKMAKSRITGYQIQLATNKKFTKNKKTVNVKGYKKVSRKVTKLKGGKKYYVKIRTYKTIKGKKYYSKWSKVKTIKTKK